MKVNYHLVKKKKKKETTYAQQSYHIFFINNLKSVVRIIKAINLL
jgi:hypothetical protein